MPVSEYRFTLPGVHIEPCFPKQLRVDEAIQLLMPKSLPVQSTGSNGNSVIPARAHGLLSTVCLSFDRHLPLVLSPDDIWLAILQGYANHPRRDASNKVVITLDVRPSPSWPFVFESFALRIRDHIGERLHDLMTTPFSTTGDVEFASFNVALMAAVKHRFIYEMQSICGIPEVRILGTPEDWSQVFERARLLLQDELKWWWRGLRPVLLYFVEASKGRPDIEAWTSVFKWNGRSGGPFVDGWINALIPYLFVDGVAVTNSYFEKAPGESSQATTLECLPSSLACASVRWNRMGSIYDVQFYGGFVGTHQFPDAAVRPAIGWAVTSAPR